MAHLCMSGGALHCALMSVYIGATARYSDGDMDRTTATLLDLISTQPLINEARTVGLVVGLLRLSV